MFNDQGECGDGRRLLVCDGCGIKRCTEWRPDQIKHYCRERPLKPPTHGPGTELKKIFDSLGIHPKASCQCAARMDEMNRRGVQGCLDTKAEILGWLQEAYGESSFSERATAGILAIANGYPMTLSGLLDLAIELAR